MPPQFTGKDFSQEEESKSPTPGQTEMTTGKLLMTVTFQALFA
jgi:hypothetical protein